MGNAEYMSMLPPAPLLRTGCGVWSRRPSGGGHLIVEPGAVRFECGSTAAKLGLPPVIHARPPVIFIRGRLLPPGFSSGLVLRGDEGTVTVLTWCGLRGRVRRALAEAEVAFFERVTWVSVGRAGGANGGVK
jgi:hypothetical protein